jgi:fibronectin-binding autotransporter adhesin
MNKIQLTGVQSRLLCGAVMCWLAGAGVALADQSWDGDNATGNFSFNNNWFSDVQPSWAFGQSLHFSFRNNSSQTSLYNDYGAWVSTDNIYWDSTFGAGLTLGSAGNGINFNQRIENDSSFAQTLNCPTSGNKNGAGHIELNPVNADLTLAAIVLNDNNSPFQVWGGNTNSLNVAVGLSGNASVSFTIQQYSMAKFTAAQAWGGSSSLNVNVGELWVDTGGSLASGLVVNLGLADANTAKFWLAASSGGVTVNNNIVVTNTTGTKVLGGLNSSGTNTFSGNVTLNGPVQLIANNSGGTVNFSGNFSGSSNLIVAAGTGGTGTVMLSGANTNFSGNVGLNAGTLKFGANNALGGTNIASLATNVSATLDFNGFSLLNTNMVFKNGGGGNFYNNNTNLTSTNAANFVDGTISDFNLGGAGSLVWTGAVQRTGSSGLTVHKTAAGTARITGSGAYQNASALSVETGTLILGRQVAASFDHVIVAGGTLQYDPNANMTAGADWQGQVNGYVQINSGTFDLNGASGNNAFMQYISGSAGALLTNSSATQAVLTMRERQSGSFTNAESIGGNISLSFQNSTGSGETLVFSGNNTYFGTNTISFGTALFSGNNTMTGLMLVSGGTLGINSSTALGTDVLTISSGAIDNTSSGSVTLANNNAQNWNGSFTFAGTTNLNLGTGAVTAGGSVTVTANTNVLTVGGVVSGGANTLTKAGTGTLALTGNNTWGTATLNVGSMIFGGTATASTESLGKIVIGNNSGTIGSQMIFSNVTANITGANNTSIGGSATATNNTLLIQGASTWNGNGQRLEMTAGVGNSFVVNNSVATNFASLVGGNGATCFGSQIIVTNGGKLYVNATGLNELGRNTGAISNSIVVTGSGSTWFNSGVGFNIGGTSGTVSNNTVQLLNGGRWDHGGSTLRLNLGNFATGITVNNGVLTNVYSMIVGNGSSSNFVTVGNGGKFYCSANSGDFREIGRGSAANNIVLITDVGSLWNGGGATWTISGTASGSNNTNDNLTVAAGGVFTNGSITVGGQGTGHSLVVSNGTAYVSTLTVNGSANVYLTGGSGDALYVDNFSGGNSSSVITGATASASSLIAGWSGSSSSIVPLITGNLALTKTGSGTLTVGSANSYTGGTTVSNGAITVGNNLALGTNLITLAGGNLGVSTAGLILTNKINLVIASAIDTTGGNFSLAGAITNTGALTKAGVNTLFLLADNPFSGGLTLSAGTLSRQGGTGSAFGSGNITINGGTLDIYGSTAQVLLNLSGAGGAISSGFSQANSAVILTNSTDTMFSGAINNLGAGITKKGSGKLTLAGANTYSGVTTISLGTLAVTNGGSISNTTSISLAGGATFDVSGLSSTFALGSGQTLTGGGGTGTIAGNVNLNAGSLALNYTNGTPALSVTNGTFSFNSNTVTVTVSGTPLAAGSYKLIAKTTGGIVSGTLPFAVTVNGVGATAAASLQIISGELYLVVGTTITALTSSKNPSGFNNSVTFTASVQTNGVTAGNATGTMTFLTNSVAFTTNGLAGGTTNFSLSVLPRGTNLIMAVYSGDANYLASTNTLNQVVTNHPPVTATMTVQRTAGLSLKVALSDLATNWSDADGDTVTLADINLVTTNGVNLLTNSSWILYTNSPNVNDQISYGISDAFGGTNIGYINIMVNSSVTGTNSITSITTGATNVVSAYGIPGYNYILERATNLAPAVWISVSTNTTATNGVISAPDVFSDLGGTPPSSAYYRLKWQP